MTWEFTVWPLTLRRCHTAAAQELSRTVPWTGPSPTTSAWALPRSGQGPWVVGGPVPKEYVLAHAYQSGPITIKEKKNRDLLRSRLDVRAHNSLVFSLYNLLINLGILLVSRDDEEDKEKRELARHSFFFYWPANHQRHRSGQFLEKECALRAMTRPVLSS